MDSLSIEQMYEGMAFTGSLFIDGDRFGTCRQCANCGTPLVVFDKTAHSSTVYVAPNLLLSEEGHKDGPETWVRGERPRLCKALRIYFVPSARPRQQRSRAQSASTTPPAFSGPKPPGAFSPPRTELWGALESNLETWRERCERDVERRVSDYRNKLVRKVSEGLSEAEEAVRAVLDRVTEASSQVDPLTLLSAGTSPLGGSAERPRLVVDPAPAAGTATSPTEPSAGSAPSSPQQQQQQQQQQQAVHADTAPIDVVSARAFLPATAFSVSEKPHGIPGRTADADASIKIATLDAYISALRSERGGDDVL